MYNTTFKSDFTYKDGSNARGTLDQALQKDLRSHHFQFGNQRGMYETTHQKFYIPHKNAERAQFNAQRAADLRADHFKINWKIIKAISLYLKRVRLIPRD